jgi:DNA sulfur modification protein DndC
MSSRHEFPRRHPASLHGITPTTHSPSGTPPDWAAPWLILEQRMQSQNHHHATLSTSISDVNELLALLQGETEIKVQTPTVSVKAKSIQEQGIETLLDLIRGRHALHLRHSAGKDSSSCAVLFIEAVRRATAEGIRTTHYISGSSTGVDSPAMEMHLTAVQNEMRQHFETHDLPIEVHLTHPSLASSFMVTTIGRGTLPRFPENSKHRQCAQDWKYAPAQKLAAELQARAIEQTGREIITVIGTRFDESTVRKARMQKRGESAIAPVRSESGELVLSIIAYWTLTDVWDTLEMLLEPESSPYEAAISQESIHRLFALYQDSNDGVCGIVLGDGGNKQPCGARTRCWNCTLTGDKDKSMESMLTQSKWEFMRPLNDFRTLLMSTQFDMDTRELVGRTVSPAGYLGVGPDVYSYQFRRAMLRYLLSIDANERDRAEKVEAAIFAGHLADTKDNRLMASPTFELVSLQMLALIDWHLSQHYEAMEAFPAVAIWHDVNVLGRRYSIPKTDKAPKITIPTKRWIKVGRFDHAAPSEGMRSIDGEMWNRFRHPDRIFQNREVDGKKTVWFDETDQLSVDAEKACAFITCTYPTMSIECNRLPASESAAFWLNEGIISLPAGHASRYQEIALRNRYFANLAQRFDLSPAEMNRYLVQNSISNAEHEKLLPPDPQFDMFSISQAA